MAALEFQLERELACTIAAKVGAAGLGDLSEVGLTDISLRVSEIGMIQHVRKGSFSTETYAFYDGYGLADTGRKADGAGSDKVADALRAKAADG